MEDGLFGNGARDKMAECEKTFCKTSENDWYVPDCCLDMIGEMEYMIYERECEEVMLEECL